MTTSGTTDFTLDLADLVDEAYERAGVEMRTGFQLSTARRSLNLLLIEWQNRGINLWTMDQQTIDLVAGAASYSLPASTVDILDHVVRTGSGETQRDVPLVRISQPDYSVLPNKALVGEPRQIYVVRGLVPSVTLWPVPDDAQTYTLVYWRMRRLEDAGDGATTQDVPFRFLPCLTAGLAYYLAVKTPAAFDRIPMLKSDYEEQWRLAAGEDRERATLRVIPGGYR